MSDVLRCPSCGSTDLQSQPASSWRCRKCDTLFVSTASSGAATSPVPTPSQGSVTAWAVVGVASVVAVGGLLWWTAPVRGPGQVDAPPNMADRPINPPRPADNTPDFQLVHQQLGTTADGRRFALQAYRNLERVPIEHPTLIATFFKDGQPRGELRYPGMIDPLPPGEDLPMLVDMGREDFDNVEILAQEPRAASGQPTLLALGTRGVHEEQRGGKSVLIGTLRNISDSTLDVTAAAFVGWTTDGEPVAWAPTMPDERRLEPGDEAEIEAGEVPYRIGPADIWTAIAAGAPLGR